MDALIRAARIAPSRARLSDVRPIATDAQPAPTSIDPLDAMRESLSTQIRAELFAELENQLRSEHERSSGEGYAAGFAQGREAAQAEAERVREELRSHAQSALAALEHAHRVALEQLQERLGDLAFAAVCRLLREQASTRSLVMQLVRNTCAGLRGESVADVRLHPRDVEMLSELMEGGELRVGALGLNVVPDESLQLGGCIVEAASGHYDGSLETQLSRLHAALSGAASARDEE